VLFKHKLTIRLAFFQREFPMGLDKTEKKVLNRTMSVKLLLKQMGLGGKSGENSKSRVSPLVRERQRFEEEVRRQFVELKKKGISIPVFTL
jgi:hypothetical protein